MKFNIKYESSQDIKGEELDLILEEFYNLEKSKHPDQIIKNIIGEDIEIDMIKGDGSKIEFEFKEKGISYKGTMQLEVSIEDAVNKATQEFTNNSDSIKEMIEVYEKNIRKYYNGDISINKVQFDFSSETMEILIEDLETNEEKEFYLYF